MDETICRTCLESLNDKTYRIKLSETLKGVQLYVYINSIADIRIEENDGLPAAMCLSCYTKLQSAIGFKETCEVSNATLRKHQFPVQDEQIEYEIKDESDTVVPQNDMNISNTSCTFHETQAYNVHEDHDYILEPDPLHEPELENIEDDQESSCNLIPQTSRNFHNKTHFECDECGEKFQSKYKITEHWKKAHNQNNLICPNCKYQAKSYVYLKKHKLSVICQKIEPKWISVTGVGSDRVFSCKACPYKVKTANSIILHVRTHTGERPHKCSVCSRGFGQLTTLIGHREYKHKLFVNNVKCTLCGQTFMSRMELRNHRYKDHNNQNTNCPVCNKCVRVKNLKTHMFLHKESKSKTCEICTKSFNTFTDLNIHRKKSDCYSKSQSPTDFEEPSELSNTMLRKPQIPVKDEHVKYEIKVKSDTAIRENDLSNSDASCSFHEKKVYNSDENNEYILEPDPLHEPEHENIEDKQESSCNLVLTSRKFQQRGSKCVTKHFECDKCGQVFESKCKMAEHWKKAHYQSQLICPNCKYQGRTTFDLEKHKLSVTCLKIEPQWISVTGVGRDRVFNCKACPYKVMTPKCIIGHVRTHTGERPYKCSVCSRGFGQLSTLEVHREYKHNLFVKNVKCTLCDRTFKSRKEVRNHRFRDHNNQKTNCTICNKSVRVSYIQMHMTRHTDSKNITCELCAKSFYTLADLNMHKNIAHGKKEKFNCKLCSYETIYPKFYESHVAKHKAGKVVCTICFIFCKDENKLSNHIRMLHGEAKKTYKCHYCDKVYYTYDSRRTHHKRKHEALWLADREKLDVVEIKVVTVSNQKNKTEA